MNRLAPLRYLTRRGIRSQARRQPPPPPRGVSSRGSRARGGTATQKGAGVGSLGIGETWYFYAGAAIFGLLAYGDFSYHRMEPRGLVRETLRNLREDSLVTAYLGKPLAHIEAIEHAKLDDEDGHDVLRIKFRISGPEGEANVYAEVARGMERGEYQYLLVEFAEDQVLEIVDNRQASLPDSQRRMKPRSLAREALAILSEDPKVAAYLGTSLVLIEDFETGRLIEHSDLMAEGSKHGLRIKFKIRGSQGVADACAQVEEGMAWGEFAYLRMVLPDGEMIELTNNETPALQW